MKKILSIFLLVLLVACVKEDIIDYTMFSTDDIFENQGGVLKDATRIEFNLDSSGDFIISLEDEFTSKVVTKELFIGKEGKNTLDVFTKVMPKGSYYLTVKDKNGNKVEQTKISI